MFEGLIRGKYFTLFGLLKLQNFVYVRTHEYIVVVDSEIVELGNEFQMELEIGSYGRGKNERHPAENTFLHVHLIFRDKNGRGVS